MRDEHWDTGKTIRKRSEGSEGSCGTGQKNAWRAKEGGLSTLQCLIRGQREMAPPVVSWQASSAGNEATLDDLLLGQRMRAGWHTAATAVRGMEEGRCAFTGTCCTVTKSSSRGHRDMRR